MPETEPGPAMSTCHSLRRGVDGPIAHQTDARPPTTAPSSVGNSRAELGNGAGNLALWPVVTSQIRQVGLQSNLGCVSQSTARLTAPLPCSSEGQRA